MSDNKDELESRLWKMRGNLFKAIEHAVHCLSLVEDNDEREFLVRILDDEVLFVSKAFRLGGTQARPPAGDLVKAMKESKKWKSS